MYKIKCGEIWGGIEDANTDLIVGGVEASLYAAASEGAKGGDIYYFSVCENDMLTRIVIADVSGHGVAVSDVSEWLYSTLKARMNAVDCSAILSELNALAVGYGYGALTTAAIAAFYSENQQLIFSYAGHYPIMLRRADEKHWCELASPQNNSVATNIPLGVRAKQPFEQNCVRLNQGDTIFLFTDGLIEAKNTDGEYFGLDRLLLALQLAGNRPKDIKKSVESALGYHVNGAISHDDITFTIFRIR